ncbi:UTRA domain-containing protein [Paenibacillus flagellatus]|uniref:Transcriptional regulator n=1 Tax=Paenibacillus flagellatus TaxID=2211139 RepID=A0A2V5JX58_9BACL|nr:UTRA domain-containing protein [Paenibacillus flagellatus]PYI51348.1 transcriptional regulator [Paenibacillus flagellatus]
MKLNNTSQEPLYLQLKNIIKEDIHRGNYKAGEQLPPEEELCETYGVSRGTVRKAIMDLVGEGILKRHQGKGTFVREESMIKRELFSMGGYSETATTTGEPLRPHILSCSVIGADDYLASFFRVEPGDRILELKRAHYIRDEVLIFETAHYSLDRFPGLERFILESPSTYSTLKRRYNIEMTYSEKTLELAYATEEEASILNCDPGTTLYVIERKSYDDDNAPIHISSSLYKTNRVKFTITVNQRKEKNAPPEQGPER